MPLSAANIVTLATQAAKCPGYTTQAGQFLNDILRDLCQSYDFDVAKSVYTFSFNSGAGTNFGPYALPMDWLRGANDGVFYTIQSVPYTMINVSNEQYDTYVRLAGLTAFPSNYTVYVGNIDQAIASNMFVWVAPSGAFPVTARYYRLMPDIATPSSSSSVPWFPNQDYLIKKLTARLMEITADERMPLMNQAADAILQKYLKLKDDNEGRVYTVELDKRVFGKRFSALPNTKLVGF